MSEKSPSEPAEDWNASGIDIRDCVVNGQGKLNASEVRRLCETNSLNVGQLQRRLVPIAQSFSLAGMSHFQVLSRCRK